LQKLADATGLEIGVCHLPPGTSKWNQIEHRLFSYITINWRGKPLHSLETVINLIAATTPSTGLEVYARLDHASYPDKIRVPDDQIKAVNLHGDPFHPEWNYTIKPKPYLSTGPKDEQSLRPRSILASRALTTTTGLAEAIANPCTRA